MDLEASGQLEAPGAVTVAAAKADGSWDRLTAVDALVKPQDLTDARAFWDRFPPSSRRGILEWINTAKRPETRERRISETVEKAARNIKANHPKGRDQGLRAGSRG